MKEVPVNEHNIVTADATAEKIEAVDAGNCQVCMWILERRFSEDFSRREYSKMNVVSENLNQKVEIVAKDADKIREKILEKFILVRESHKLLTD